MICFDPFLAALSVVALYLAAEALARALGPAAARAILGSLRGMN